MTRLYLKFIWHVEYRILATSVMAHICIMVLRMIFRRLPLRILGMESAGLKFGFRVSALRHHLNLCFLLQLSVVML
jgi:hypothetical protein